MLVDVFVYDQENVTLSPPLYGPYKVELLKDIGEEGALFRVPILKELSMLEDNSIDNKGIAIKEQARIILITIKVHQEGTHCLITQIEITFA